MIKKCIICPKCKHPNDIAKVSDSAEFYVCEKCRKESKIEEFEVVDFGEVQKKEEPKKKTQQKTKAADAPVLTAKKTGNSSRAVASDKPRQKPYPAPVVVGRDTDHLALTSTKDLRFALAGEGEVTNPKNAKLQGMGLTVSQQFKEVSSLPLAKMLSTFQLEFVKKPALYECTPSSIAFAMIDAGKAGIYPDGKHGALIPFKNYKKDVKELKFMPMAKGIIAEVLTSKRAKKINVQVVYEEDTFTVSTDDLGDLRVNHEIDFDGEQDENKIKAAYCIILMNNGERIVELLRSKEIEKFKAKSQAEKAKTSKGYKSNDNHLTPWEEWPAQMIKKTVVKRACQYLMGSDNDD